MRDEFSAGVVVYKISGGEPVYLVLKYAHQYSAYWEFPKGKIEPGETAEKTALRELYEEAGIDSVTISDAFSEDIYYNFRDKAGEKVSKTVTFFLATTDDVEVVLSEEHSDYAWLNFEPAYNRLTHENAKNILIKVHEFLMRPAE